MYLSYFTAKQEVRTKHTQAKYLTVTLNGSNFFVDSLDMLSYMFSYAFYQYNYVKSGKKF